MRIDDLDHLNDIDDVGDRAVGAGTTFTASYTVAAVDYGIAFSQADAFAFGENTLTSTSATAYVDESKSSTQYLTKTTFYGEAKAEATAIASQAGSIDISSSQSYAEYSYTGYYVSA